MKIKEIILTARQYERDLAVMTEKYNKFMATIQSFFDKSGLKEYEVEDEDSSRAGNKIVAVKSEQVRINYKVEELQKKLDKELFNEITTKMYVVHDIEFLKKIFKKAGATPTEFKQCIETQTTVNKEKIKQLFSVGEITLDTIKGCYDAKITKTVKLKDRKGDTD